MRFATAWAVSVSVELRNATSSPSVFRKRNLRGEAPAVRGVQRDEARHRRLPTMNDIDRLDVDDIDEQEGMRALRGSALCDAERIS